MKATERNRLRWSKRWHNVCGPRIVTLCLAAFDAAQDQPHQVLHFDMPDAASAYAMYRFVRFGAWLNRGCTGEWSVSLIGSTVTYIRGNK